MNYRRFIAAVAAVFAFLSPVMAQNKVMVSGIVKDASDGQPIIGAAVAYNGDGVITDLEGKFSFRFPEGSSITVSQMGYVDQTLTVPAGVKEWKIEVSLQIDRQMIEESVVIAYGVRKKGTVAGSVASIKADKLENTPTAAFDQALQGQVAGLTVLSSTGEPSSSATMTIRGTNSINSGTAPLYILDGMPISAADFNTINPADIENISVLKDATSTSIYGARAANGVIVITTKRGKVSERPNIDFHTQLGISRIAVGKWDQMNTEERIRYEKEIGLTDGKNYDFLSKTDVNWLKEVYSDNALLQNYEMSISGADDKTNYYVSGGYYDQQGIAIGSGFKRYSFKTNFERRAADWFTMGVNANLNYQEIEQADEGNYTLVTPISASRFMLPYYSPKKENGSLASVNDGSWKGMGQNPLEWLANNPLNYKKYKLFTSAYVELEILKNLKFRSQAGVDFSHVTALSKSFPSYKPNLEEGTASRQSTDGMNLTITNTLNYSFDIDKIHDFHFLLGQEGVNYHFEAFSVATAGQTNDKLTDIATGTRATSWSSTADSDYSFLSFFGRGEYNYANKYYLEASLRTDGSSRFGKNNRWAAFWAVGGMWDIRNEDFAAPVKHWLTTAQIAINTGTSGNSSIPNYEHLALMVGGADYVGQSGMVPSQMGNDKLTWETTWANNLAFRAGFFSRINTSLEFYWKKTYNMLMEVPLSYTTSNGFGYRWDNVGGMVNAGAEFNIDALVVNKGDFRWNVNANFSYNYNVITELYNGVTEYESANTNTKLMVGHPVGEFFINRFAGVNPANGEALWYTKDGEITNVLRESDKVMIGKTYFAPWQGGFGTSLSWKGLTASAQFSWVADRWMINNDRYFDESNGRFQVYNQSRRLLNRWKKPGDITDIPRHGIYTEFDSRLLEDASFMRLKNLMVSYSLPKTILGKQKVIRGVRVYAQGQNLLTFTNFSGLDPEGTANIYAAQYPMSRQYTFGIDLSF
ncbi:MAG: TonB-dependent receptor [Bacteroidales bacterium]|nr:TonB-dependent receptor [Candidatus Cryptobacteroides equifaecalis]